jgi:uncharacterized protein
LCAASGKPTISAMKRFVPASPLGQLVAAHREQLLAAAATRHARDVRLFGSLARGQDSSKSDVDILVTLDDGARPLDLLSLACDAEDILGVRVDVGTVENLRPEIRADALNDAVLL